MKLERLEGAVWRLVIDKPPANVIGLPELDALRDIISQLEAEPEAKVLVVTGSLRFFSAGADLSMMQEAMQANNSVEELTSFAAELQSVLRAFRNLPVCTIAVIEGAAVGGGLELALSCDLRVAGPNARCGLPEIKLGLIPAAGGTQILSEVAGRAVASRLIMTGEIVGGEDILSLGLVHWIVENPLDYARSVAMGMSNFPKQAIAANKACIMLSGRGDDAGYKAEIEGTRSLHGSTETCSLITEFFNQNRTSTGVDNKKAMT